MKRLYKSEKNRVFGGVIGGVGEYFNIDPVILRVIWVIMVAFTGFVPGIIAYLVANFVIPERPAKSK